MRRRRDLPADPVRSTAETLELLRSLLEEALPSVSSSEIATAMEAFDSFAFYLIPGEHLARDPATLVAGDLACDFYTLHGEEAVGADDPGAPPGAAKATTWELYVAVPDGAPFGAEELEDADPHLRAGRAPDGAGAASAREAVSLADLVDPEALRLAGGG